MEIMVTLGILAILTSLLILYSRTGEKRVILFKEQAKVVSSIMRTKSLAIQTFSEKPDFPAGYHLCGYGLHFYNDGRFIIFRDISENCETTGERYTERAPDDPLYELVSENKLAVDLQFEFPAGLTEIFFLPPEPETEITPSGPAQININLVGADTPPVGITVTNAGQITTQP